MEGAQRHEEAPLVSPPSIQCSAWWTSMKRSCVQPGKAQPPSRAMTARRRAGGMRLVLRPMSRMWPCSSRAMAVKPQSHARRRKLSAETWAPSSNVAVWVSFRGSGPRLTTRSARSAPLVRVSGDLFSGDWLPGDSGSDDLDSDDLDSDDLDSDDLDSDDLDSDDLDSDDLDSDDLDSDDLENRPQAQPEAGRSQGMGSRPPARPLASAPIAPRPPTGHHRDRLKSGSTPLGKAVRALENKFEAADRASWTSKAGCRRSFGEVREVSGRGSRPRNRGRGPPAPGVEAHFSRSRPFAPGVESNFGRSGCVRAGGRGCDRRDLDVLSALRDRQPPPRGARSSLREHDGGGAPPGQQRSGIGAGYRSLPLGPPAAQPQNDTRLHAVEPRGAELSMAQLSMAQLSMAQCRRRRPQEVVLSVPWPPLAPVAWSPLAAPVDGLPPLASGLICSPVSGLTSSGWVCRE